MAPTFSEMTAASDRLSGSFQDVANVLRGHLNFLGDLSSR
jgi:hypothetical protein